MKKKVELSESNKSQISENEDQLETMGKENLSSSTGKRKCQLTPTPPQLQKISGP